MRRGFTLIELLIVVAIIAILAAIAVPNFLEAQTRSKVSRVKADMRSIALAIESYAVDNQRHPLDVEELKDHNVPGDLFIKQMVVLTTPISYISTIPRDPFTEKGRVASSGSGQGAKSRTFIYETSEITNDNGNSDITFRRGYTWWLQSYGPTRSRRHPASGIVVWSEGILNGLAKFGPMVYDPTNGTVSFGFILRTNKGVFDGSEWKPR